MVPKGKEQPRVETGRDFPKALGKAGKGLRLEPRPFFPAHVDKGHRSPWVVEQVEFPSVAAVREMTWIVAVRGYQDLIGLGLWLGHVEQVSKEAEFSLDWILTEIGGSFAIG